MKRHIIWLNNYISRKLTEAKNPEPLKLKRLHTFKVFANARKIVEAELTDPELMRASQLAALYHDIARFDQYLLYGTFKDAQSFNHGLMGTRILKREGLLNGEESHLAALVLAGVGLHNRRAVPERLAPKPLIVTNIIRDADKLDILRVMDAHLKQKPYNPTVVLGLPDSQELCNPLVIESALKGECASYNDLRSVNDFRVLLGSWLFSMNFESSRKLFLDSPHARNLVEALPSTGSYAEVRNFLLNTYKGN